VPKGTQLGVHPLSANQWAANFTDPLEFRPERWLGDPKYQHDRREALQPFSIGPRNCLGKNLAWHEMRLMLATVLLHFDLELCDESTAWADQKVYVLCEKGPLMCRLKLAGRAK
jgi:cytochrome P450